MSRDHWNRASICAVIAAQCLAMLWLHSAAIVHAQQLPIRHYGVADGLPQSWISSVFQDSKGYVWVSSGMGISRFDGYHFTTYDARDELGDNTYFSAITEDRQGRIWVGTFGGAGSSGKGVARLIDDSREAESLRQAGATPMPRSHFVVYPVGNSPESNNVERLLFDADQTLWCVTDAGLYRAAAESTDRLDFELVRPREKREKGDAASAAFTDSKGRLWFGLDTQLIRITQGRVLKYGPPDEIGRFDIAGLAEDRQGRLLAANTGGLFEFIPPTEINGRGSWKRLPLALLPQQVISSLAFDSTDTLWIGTEKGLIKYKEGRQTLYTTAQGLSALGIRSLFVDRERNLWIATNGGGVCKLHGEMIISFTEKEGLPDRYISWVIEDQQGRIYAVTGQSGVAEIVDGKAVLIPGSDALPSGISAVLQDRRGDWWVGTERGLFRFLGPKLQFRRGKKFTGADGIPETWVRTIHEDASGTIWVSLTPEYLFRFVPGEPGRAVSERETFASFSFTTGVIKMLDDPSGMMWLASHSQLGRRMNGRVSVFEPTEGLPEARPRALFKDSRGWLWIGLRNRGVSMTTDPTADRPHFINYSTKNGLSNDTVWSIIEDDFGRIYLGTDNGVNQLDPSTGKIRHITTNDGVAGDAIHHLIKDTNGAIWIATNAGLSRYDPHAERAVKLSPPIYFDRIQAAGEEIPLTRGAGRAPELSLSASQNNLRIEYVGLSFQGERALMYQYKLEGVDSEWNPPNGERLINYARLAPGSYRFLVRATNRDGLSSREPAEFAFRILPPLWQRWWFLTLAALVLAGVAAMIYRYRVARLLELERVRTRIAADLHDDIGASLSEVALLSEVLKQKNAITQPDSLQMLTQIAERARGVVDTMSDVVWAIDPRRDDLRTVILRISELASDVLEAKGIACEIQAPPEPEKIKLTPEQRRHLFLIFKEALTNIMRHADCRRASLSVSVSDHQLVAEIQDDGCGLASLPLGEGVRRSRGGHGLENMQARAAELGGQLRVDSTPGQGTRLTLIVPLR